ncbi:glycosyltransferase family 39 protein [Methylomonas sp. AM2-LC]|uniref:ArnT family glycosyltransferase n=1 Tax=Methylomonas sp. AM2-LC TaxID=3153301 RepID=UPI003264CD76
MRWQLTYALSLTQQRVIITMIFCAGLILRLQSIRFGYPLSTHPDEPTLVNIALGILNTADLNPHFFNYPSLVIYLQTLLSALLNCVYAVFMHGSLDTIPNIQFYMLGRGFAACMSSLSLLLIWQIGKRLISPLAGLFAAAIATVSPLHVDNSALVTTDIWVANFSVLVLWYACKIYAGGQKRDYILAGIAVGVCTGSKYTALVSFTMVLVAHYVYCRTQQRPLGNKQLVYAVLFAGIGFLATTPYALLEPLAFIRSIRYEAYHYRTGHLGFEAIGDHSYNLYFNALYSNSGLGPWVTSLALLALCFIADKRYRYLSMLAVFPVLLLLLIGYYKVFFVRNMVGTLPCLALLAAFSLQFIFNKLSVHLKQPVLQLAITSCLILLICLPLAIQSTQEMLNKNLPDTRWLSLTWIKANLPPHSKIAREFFTPPVETISTDYTVVELGISGLATNADKIDNNVDYVIVSSRDDDRFFDGRESYAELAKRYSTYFANHRLVYELTADTTRNYGPSIRIYENKRVNQYN